IGDIQLGLVAVRTQLPSGAVMVPFHPVPWIDMLQPIWNTTWNEVIGAGNELLVTRTAPLKPPLHTFVVTTSTVTPPPVTATSAAPALVAGAPAVQAAVLDTSHASAARRQRRDSLVEPPMMSPLESPWNHF